MSAQSKYTRLLADEEMRGHLERKETLLFEGLGHEWQKIEEQVERLGFGEVYIVSKSGSHPGSVRVKPSGFR